MEGTNIEAITIYVYPQQFIMTAQNEITGINSNIQINRKTHNIAQIDKSTPIPSDFIQKITCSAFLGIIPVLHKHFLVICVLDGCPIYQIKKTSFLPFEFQEGMTGSMISVEEPSQKLLNIQDQNTKVAAYVTYMKKYLLVEGYYFSFKYKLSLSRSAHARGHPPIKKYLWNKHIAKNLKKLPDKKWVVNMIQGSISHFKIVLQGGTVFEYTLITRRSSVRGGTRYNSRGIDIKGNIANFCETQQIMLIGNKCYSHVQIRGSVPLYWTQTGLTSQVLIEKTVAQNSVAFSRHFQKLIKNHHKVMCINLLSKQKRGEVDLIVYYQKLIKETSLKNVKYEYFDFHQACKNRKFQHANYLIHKIKGVNKYFGYYMQDIQNETVLAVQQGVVRVNCLDSLDRTNLIQSKIAYQTITQIFQSLNFNLKDIIGSPSIILAADNIENDSVLVMQLKNIWADNGDMISKHYTGTGSTHTNITRTGRRDFKGIMDHSFKSFKRFYQQYFDDNYKQQVIDVLLGEHTQTVNLQEMQAHFKGMQEQDEDSFKNVLEQQKISNL